jgi:protein O-mannosyl-transferase
MVWFFQRASLWTGLIAIIVYWDDTALHGGWVYDDAGSVIKNVVVNGMVPWEQAFTRDYWGIEMKESQSHKSFRPITTLTLKANYVIADKYYKTDPNDKHPPTYGFHIVNVLLHGLVTALITEATYYCFLEWSTTASITVLQLIVGFLFGLHPVHAEVVSNITSRGELLMSTFMLLAFLSYAKSVQKLYDNHQDDDENNTLMNNNDKTANPAAAGSDTQLQSSQPTTKKSSSALGYYIGVYILPWLFMTLSLFSKEQGATTLISLVAWDLIQHYDSLANVCTIIFHRPIVNPSDAPQKQLAWSLVRRAIGLALQTIVVVLWRYVLNGETTPDFIAAQNPAGFAEDRWTRAFSVTWVYCLYIRDALWPFYLCPDWSGVSIDLITDYLTDLRAMGVVALWYFAATSLGSVIFGGGGRNLAAGGMDSETDPNHNKAYKSDDVGVQPPAFFLDTITLRKVNMAVWAFCFSPFLLSSNILVVVGLMKADRVIYLPLFGFCLLEALVLSKLFFKQSVTMQLGIERRRHAEWWMGYFLVMFQLWILAGRTHQRNLAWSNSLDLWEQAYLINPRSHHTMYNYGYELSIRQRYAEAATVLAPIGSPRVDGPSNTFVYTMVLFNLNRCDEANELLDDAFRVLDEKRAEGGPRNTDSALGRTKSNLLVARAHCAVDITERGRILYEAVHADPSNDYAVQIAHGLMEKMQQMENIKQQYK